MGPAHALQDRSHHGLGVHRYPVYPVPGQDGQLVLGDGVGPPGLHGELGTLGEVYVRFQCRKHLVKLLCRQGGGGAASHVDRAHCPPGLPKEDPGGFNFPAEGRHERLHQRQALVHRCRDEGAVHAPGGAKGDANVEGNFVGGKALNRLHALPGAVHGQSGPEGGNVVVFFQLLLGFLGGCALQNGSGGELGRPHPGEGTPGQIMAQQYGTRLIKTLFYRPLEGVVELFLGSIQFGAVKAYHPVVRPGEGGRSYW